MSKHKPKTPLPSNAVNPRDLLADAALEKQRIQDPASLPVPPKPRAVFVEPNPFVGQSSRVAGYIPDYYSDTKDWYPEADTTQARAVLSQQTSVARPTRGIMPKPNTYASVQVITAAGKRVPLTQQPAQAREQGLLSGALGRGSEFALHALADTDLQTYVWTDWLLQSASEQRAEKTQLVETFGETYLYAFGERPRVVSFQGVLYNTADLPWRSMFWQNWDRFFRATRLVEMNARLYLHYDDLLLEGYPLDAQAQQTANEPNVVTFSFNFLVTSYVDLVARTGYSVAQRYTPDTVKAGYGDSADEFELRDDRVSLLEFLGLSGAAKAAGAVNRGLQAVGASSDLAGLAGGSVYDVLSGEVTAKGMTTSGLAAVFELLAPNATPGTAEEQLAFATKGAVKLKPGEVNKWFGLVGDVLRGGRSPQSLAIPPALERKLSDSVVGAMNYTGGGLSLDNVGPRAGTLLVSALPLP